MRCDICPTWVLPWIDLLLPLIAMAVFAVAALWLIFVLPLYLTRWLFGAIDEVSKNDKWP